MEKLPFKVDALGNIVDESIEIPDYNVIKQEDDMLVAKKKRVAQKKLWDEAHAE